MSAETPRVVLVTGASRGIGLAIGNALEARGHSVIAISRRSRELPHQRFTWITADVSDTSSFSATLEQVLRDHPIDAVISNAGAPAFGHLEQWSPAQIEQSIATNLSSHMILARVLIPHLRKHAHSDFMVMGSIAGVRPGKQGSVYCAAKAGLRGFTGALRPEVSSSGVRVSLVMPGMVDTDFYSEQHFGPGTNAGESLYPADVAAPIATILESPPHVVFDEVILSPLKHVVRKR